MFRKYSCGPIKLLAFLGNCDQFPLCTLPSGSKLRRKFSGVESGYKIIMCKFTRQENNQFEPILGQTMSNLWWWKCWLPSIHPGFFPPRYQLRSPRPRPGILHVEKMSKHTPHIEIDRNFLKRQVIWLGRNRSCWQPWISLWTGTSHVTWIPQFRKHCGDRIQQ